MGLSRANNTATVLGADVVRRLRDRFLGSKRRHSVPAPAGRRLRSLARQENFSLAVPYDYSEFNKPQVLQENDGSHS